MIREEIGKPIVAVVFAGTLATGAVFLALVCMAVGFQEGRDFEAELRTPVRTVAEVKCEV